MTLTATTTAAAGDCDRGMMASEFGRTLTLSSLSWTRTGGGGGGGTQHGSNNDNHRIDNRPPPRMLVGVPMPFVHYRTNLDFPGIKLPPSLRDARTDHPGRFDNASYSKCKLLDVTTVLVPWEDDGGGETKPAVIVDGETYYVVELRRGAVVPRRQSLSSLLLYHPSERASWLRSKLHGAIYGRPTSS
jgi:hypothetical protein